MAKDTLFENGVATVYLTRRKGKRRLEFKDIHGGYFSILYPFGIIKPQHTHGKYLSFKYRRQDGSHLTSSIRHDSMTVDNFAKVIKSFMSDVFEDTAGMLPFEIMKYRWVEHYYITDGRVENLIKSCRHSGKYYWYDKSLGRSIYLKGTEENKVLAVEAVKTMLRKLVKSAITYKKVRSSIIYVSGNPPKKDEVTFKTLLNMKW